MKKMGMQRNNNEAMQQKLNSHTFVDDADFLEHATLFIAAVSTDDYTTQKTTFFEQFGLLSHLFLVFCKEFMWKMTVYAFYRPNYTLLSI